MKARQRRAAAASVPPVISRKPLHRRAGDHGSSRSANLHGRQRVRADLAQKLGGVDEREVGPRRGFGFEELEPAAGAQLAVDGFVLRASETRGLRASRSDSRVSRRGTWPRDGRPYCNAAVTEAAAGPAGPPCDRRGAWRPSSAASAPAAALRRRSARSGSSARAAAPR